MKEQFNIKNYRNIIKKNEFIQKHIMLEFEGQKFKFDYVLKEHIDILIKDTQDNDDAQIIIVGPEGAGKTWFGSQVAYYIAHKLNMRFNIGNMQFDGQDYINFSLANGKYYINFLDESRRALNKMRASSTANQDFMNYLSECRSQNQFHIILLPAFTDLDRYVAVHRVKLVLSIVKRRDEHGNLIRGEFNIWNSKDKAILNKMWEDKYKPFPKSALIHRGKFEKVFCVDEKDYNDKKEGAKIKRYVK